MKKLVVAVLLVAGMLSYAQEKQEKMDGRRSEGMENNEQRLTPEQRVEMQIKRLGKNLNLDAKQTELVRGLLTDQQKMHESKKAEFEAMRTSGQRPTESQRTEMKAKMDANRADFDNKMKAILTPEQFAKWNEGKEEHKEKFEERRNEKRKERKTENSDKQTN